MNSTLLSSLACPRCQQPLRQEARRLACPHRHVFPVRDGITLFVPKARRDTYDDEVFAQFYLQTHYREAIKAQLRRRRLARLDLNGFFANARSSYYGDIVQMLHGIVTRDSTVLDLGCSVGRLTFECAKHAGRAFGIDPSRLHVQLAREILQRRRFTVSFGQSRAIYEKQKITKVSVPVSVPRNVEFFVGDDSTLPFADGSVDAVISSAVIDRVPDCRAFLEHSARVIRPGGHFLVTAPFQWYETTTPPENWLGKGGYGTRKRSPERALQELMGRLGFRLVRSQNIPWETSIDLRYYIVWNVYAGLFIKSR